MDSVDQENTPSANPSEYGISESEKKESVHRKPEGASYSSQEYHDMRNDSSMRYVYTSQRPAAGHPSAQGSDPVPTGRRHYKTASETNESVPDIVPMDLSTNHHHEPEAIAYSSQEYVAMKSDPSMSQVYSSERAAAGGGTSPHNRQDVESSPSSRRHYKMASDITDNRSGASSPGPRLIEPIPVDSPLNMSPSRHMKPEGSSYSNQEYVDMKDDPSMRLVYSSQRPAAGYPSPHIPNNAEPHPTGRRHYKTADDIVETELDRSKTSSPGPELAE